MTAAGMVPWYLAAWFYAKLFGFKYAAPVVLGFLVTVLYQISSRLAASGAHPVAVFAGSGLAASVMLLGWGFVARSLMTAPLYGIGFGAGSALMSRVYAVTRRCIIWRSDGEAIERLRRYMRQAR